MSEHKTKSEALRLVDREKYQAAKDARVIDSAPRKALRRAAIADLRKRGRALGW